MSRGDMQELYERLGVQGVSKSAARVGHVQRDDVTSHIITCATHGYLNDTEAAARIEQADKAKTAADLMLLVGDLPDLDGLAKVSARKRLAKRQHGQWYSRAAYWLTEQLLGRITLHTAILGVLVTVMAVPMAIVAGGGLAQAVGVPLIVVGCVAVIADIALFFKWCYVQYNWGLY